MKGIVAENARDLAVMINESLKTRDKRNTLRPFNRFDTERSMWWIVPPTDYPAYRFGKFFIGEDNGKLEVGLHVEKGLIQSADQKRELMLDDSWVWHDFVEDMANSKVGNRLEAIQQTVGDDIGIEVRVEIPDLIDAGDERGKRSIGFRRGQWSDELSQEPTDLKILPDWVTSIEGIGWYWVDIFLTFTLAKHSEAQAGDWSAYDIVRHLLEPLEGWVR